MQRFLKNRWALILTLCFGLALGSYGSSAAGDGDPSRDANTDPIPSVGGDPDVPSGGGLDAGTDIAPRKRLIIERRVVGDVRVVGTSSSDMMWRLFAVLQGLRAIWFRF